MSNSFVFSKILPLNSIVNLDTPSSECLDSQNPFSFFDYIKNINSNLSPIQTNDFYLEYLKQWGEFKKQKSNQIDQTIQERYIEFVKEIILKFTTLDEKRFLSNIDYEDDTDLDILLPFISKKIREICDFYASKREKIKHKSQKIKNKGTPNSIEQAVFETITDVVFSDALEVGTYQKIVEEKDLLKNLNIEIEELYDLYTNYLDNDPSTTYDTYDVKTELRKNFYSANINDIDANIFINFDQAVVNQLIQNVKVFLIEFGRIFTVNYDITSVDLNCKPDEKLYNLVQANKPKAQRIVSLSEKLIKKYIGCDFYYITTGSTITDVTSSVLFKADNPSGNLLNRHFPTTATIEEESDLQSCRRIGLFFTPEKNSILYYSVPEKKFKIDSSKLEPNKLYIFPDPELYGNTTGLSKITNETYPLLHICDYTKSIKNQSCVSVEGDINSNPYSQDFYAYFSRNQLADQYSMGKNGLTTNFSSIYNKGILTKWATDIYGNQYGLFKSKNKRNLIDNTTNISLTTNICEEYDGGPIKFLNNGNLPEEVFISNKNWVKPNVWASDYYYNLAIEGGIGKIVNGIMERGIYDAGYVIDGLDIDRTKIVSDVFDIILNTRDGNTLQNIDGNNYTNSIPITTEWDINANTTSFANSYGTVIEDLYYNRDGNNMLSKPSKQIDGNPIRVYNEFSTDLEYDYVLSSIKYKEFDAGFITDECDEDFNFEHQTRFIINETLSANKTILANNTNDIQQNSYEVRNLYGTLMVKNVSNNTILPLISALKIQLANKYDDNFEEILDFNVYNDFIFIRTKNNIIFEKIAYSYGEYVYSGTSNSFLKTGSNENYMHSTSNPFIFENRDYAMVVNLSADNILSNNFYIIPSFYKIDYKTCVKTLITSNFNISAYINNSSLNHIKIARINQPVFSYNSRNNKYCVTATIEDQNEFAYIYQMKFDYDGNEILNLVIKLYNFNGTEVFSTINFYDEPSLSNNIVINNINTSTDIVVNNEGMSFS